MPIGAIIQAAAQVPAMVNQIFTAFKQKKMAKKILLNDPTYQASPYAKDQLALARNAFNGRMAGATSAEQNIFTNQANQVANVNRNATDSSQALALAAGIGGQTNQSLNELGAMEAQNKNAMLGNYNAALQGMTEEERRIYQDKLRKYLEAAQAKKELQNASMTNMQNAFNQFGNMGAQFGNSFGGGGGGSGSMGGIGSMVGAATSLFG